eukprot:6206148-Pleurochrysis_carterae.AAC.4
MHIAHRRAEVEGLPARSLRKRFAQQNLYRSDAAVPQACKLRHLLKGCCKHGHSPTLELHEYRTDQALNECEVSSTDEFAAAVRLRVQTGRHTHVAAPGQRWRAGACPSSNGPANGGTIASAEEVEFAAKWRRAVRF